MASQALKAGACHAVELSFVVEVKRLLELQGRNRFLQLATRALQIETCVLHRGKVAVSSGELASARG